MYVCVCDDCENWVESYSWRNLQFDAIWQKWNWVKSACWWNLQVCEIFNARWIPPSRWPCTTWSCGFAVYMFWMCCWFVSLFVTICNDDCCCYCTTAIIINGTQSSRRVSLRLDLSGSVDELKLIWAAWQTGKERIWRSCVARRQKTGMMLQKPMSCIK